MDEGFDADSDGYRTCDGDCDDASAVIHPFRIEVCGDGIDSNCDGLDSEGSDEGDAISLCGGDCDGSNKFVHRFHPEICDGIDNDCDGLIDENFDRDGDGHYTCFGDCNDDPEWMGELAYAGRDETAADCDEIDNDCNGVVDDLWPDSDGDGYTECQGDCDQEQGWASPASEEVCSDEVDNDCDGDIDGQDLECSSSDTGLTGTGNPLDVQGSIPAGWFCAVVSPPPFPSALMILLASLFLRRREVNFGPRAA